MDRSGAVGWDGFAVGAWRAQGDAIRDRWGLACSRLPESWIDRLAKANDLPSTALNKTSEFGTAFVASCLDVVLRPDAFDYPGRSDMRAVAIAPHRSIGNAREVEFPHWKRLNSGGDDLLILCTFEFESAIVTTRSIA